MRLVFLGPPGAGKGTQAKRVAERLSIPAISTGDIFRTNVSSGTELGVLAKSYMDKGEYVPDSVTNDMVKSRLAEPDAAKGFLLDGYPRTTAQVERLDAMLAENGQSLDCVLELTADTDEVVQRLLKRAQIEGRADDTEEVIRRRMEVYEEQTAPLTQIYSAHGLLRRADGMGPVDEVTDRIVQALEG
jgi:adenylate kinase